MSAAKRKIARLTARVEVLEAQLAAKHKAGDAYAAELLGHPTSERREPDYAASMAAGFIETFPEYDARKTASRQGVSS